MVTPVAKSFWGHALSLSDTMKLTPNASDPAAPPPPLTPAQTPNPKPQSKGIQQSFLSGVAGSALSGGAQGGGGGGKTLLGQ